MKFIATESDEIAVYTEPMLVFGFVFLMRSAPEGWLLAGVGVDTPPEPGWPPKPGHPAT